MTARRHNGRRVPFGPAAIHDEPEPEPGRWRIALALATGIAAFVVIAFS